MGCTKTDAPKGPSAAAPAKKEPPAASMPAEQFAKEIIADANAAKAKYGDKVVELTGTVKMLDRGIGRHGYDVYAVESTAGPVGSVTSGTQTPYLKKAIGLAYVPIELAAAGTEIDVDIRGRRSRARVVPLPFYKRR